MLSNSQNGNLIPSNRSENELDEFARPTDINNYRANQPSIIIEATLAFLKRPWIVFLSVLMISIPAGLFLFTQPAMYQAQSVISTVQNNAMATLGFDALAGTGNKGRDEYYYVSILESNAYYNKINNEVLKRWPEFKASEDSISALIRGSVTYTKKPRAIGFFAISAQARSPEFAKALADIALNSFESITVDLRRRESNLIAVFVEKQIDNLNVALADNESKIQEFFERRNMSYGDVLQGVDTELRNLQSSFAQAETERDLAKLQIDTYTTQLNDRVSTYLSDNRDSNEGKQLGLLNDRMNELVALSADTMIQRDTLKFSRIQRERQDLIQQISNVVSGQDSGGRERSPQASVKNLEEALQKSFLDYEAAQIRYVYFESAINQFVKNNPNLPADILEYFTLTRTKNVLQKTVDIMVEMREKTKIQLASETGGVEVIDYPSLPGSPISQRRGSKMLIAIAMSIGLGLTLCYVIDRFDNTVQGEADLQNRYNLAIYGSIPVLDSDTSKRSGYYARRREGKQKTLVGSDTKRLNNYTESSPVAEAYHSIKTAIEFTKRDRSLKSFVVTSPVASDGKSLTTYNLGVSFARNGLKVLIIDADLRRASQHKLFEVKRSPGFTDVMNEESNFEECLVKSNVKGLEFLPAGGHISNPAAMLSSKATKEFIEKMEEQYDLVLIDTPPITPCMDSRHLALMTGGGLILVVRAEKTKINILEHAISLLMRANVEVLGVIVNHASLRYGYGYYYMYQHYNPYGYYYSGYHYYYHTDSETGEKVKTKKRKSKSSEKETGVSL